MILTRQGNIKVELAAASKKQLDSQDFVGSSARLVSGFLSDVVACSGVVASAPKVEDERAVAVGLAFDASVGTGTELSGRDRSGISWVGLDGPALSISICRLCRSSSFAVGSHCDWSGTPSARGRFPASFRSCPQNVGLRTGAGVTGRDGRSNSVGKSVSIKLGLLCCGSAGGSSVLGESAASDPMRSPCFLFSRSCN